MRKIKKSRNMTTNRTNRSKTNGSPSLRGISSYLVSEWRERQVRDSKKEISFNVKLFKFFQTIMTLILDFASERFEMSAVDMQASSGSLSEKP